MGNNIYLKSMLNLDLLKAPNEIQKEQLYKETMKNTGKYRLGGIHKL